MTSCWPRARRPWPRPRVRRRRRAQLGPAPSSSACPNHGTPMAHASPQRQKWPLRLEPVLWDRASPSISRALGRKRRRDPRLRGHASSTTPPAPQLDPPTPASPPWATWAAWAVSRYRRPCAWCYPPPSRAGPPTCTPGPGAVLSIVRSFDVLAGLAAQRGRLLHAHLVRQPHARDPRWPAADPLPAIPPSTVRARPVPRRAGRLPRDQRLLAQHHARPINCSSTTSTGWNLVKPFSDDLQRSSPSRAAP